MITKIIAVIVFLVSFQGFNDISLFERFNHSPYRVVHYKEYYRLLTSGFLHGSWVHLLVNLFVFWQFGEAVEVYIFYAAFGKVIGMFLYLALVLISIIVANIHSTLEYKNNYNYGSIGLSGAVSAILFASVLYAPWNWLGFMIIIPIPALVFAVLYLWYSNWASKNSRDNIDHTAHFYGAIFGWVYTIIVYPEILSVFIARFLEGPTWPPPNFF